MKKVYPSFRYHKVHGSKVVHSETEHAEHEKEGWVDSPAKFDEVALKPVEPVEPVEGEEVEPPAEDSESEEQSEEELKDLLMSMGVPKKKLKDKTKAELIEMVNEAHKE